MANLTEPVKLDTTASWTGSPPPGFRVVWQQRALVTSPALCPFCFSVKPSLQVLRARFSEITARAVRTACENLTEPDQRVSDAVDVRQELDLRIGEEGAVRVGGQGSGAHPAVTLPSAVSPSVRPLCQGRPSPGSRRCGCRRSSPRCWRSSLSATAAASSPPWGSWWRGSKPFRRLCQKSSTRSEVWARTCGAARLLVQGVVCALPSLPPCHVSEVALALPVMGLSPQVMAFLCPRQ